MLVVPAAPALASLPFDSEYREALLEADMAITDSSFMVLLWNLLEGEPIRRLSGLQYFCELIRDEEFRQTGAVLYVMASAESAHRNRAWLQRRGIIVPPELVYVAPQYENGVADRTLLKQITALRPKHVVITIGGGVQERLGLYIKRSLDYMPSIHCIGAAIAFRSGDQVYIPEVADRLALGWLFRCLWRPKDYVPRYWAARRLAWLLLRYRRELPPLEADLLSRATKSPAFPV
ncbi:hypothetical protein ACPOL_5966 [Acidisarcina polymorpha]|uniref:N-acetylmannosaminyltransferase n=1 Tax=Acidisarcina polymorpha TaxID=2211140 RepID=A0A2Z5G893_9BACT|nr:hypothetical protein ACPOL_5966 [Acidisarcina polymorpha]